MRCKDDRSFEFLRVPPGEYFLHAPSAMPGHDVEEGGVRVTVKPGQTVEVEVPYR
jgi:hypothetical protein